MKQTTGRLSWLTIMPLLVALLATTLLAQDAAMPWGQFRGPGGLGVSTDKNLPVTWGQNENLVWKVELPGRGASSPIIVGDRIFLTCYTGANVDQLQRFVLCMNRADGRVVWNKPVESKLPEQATIRENHGYTSSTPVADAERLYVFFGKTGVLAFDHAGKQLWQADVGSKLNGWGSAASPVLFGDMVIVNASVESESVVALDKKTGKEVWRAPGINDSWHAPLVVDVQGRKELVVAMMGKVVGLDPATGQLLWSCKTGIQWYMVPGLVAHDGVIYCIGGRSGGALAIRAGGRGDVTATHRVWTGNKGSNVSSLIYHDGHLYWMHENTGVAYCSEAATGRIVYEQRIERAGQVYASPVLADGKVYYLTRSGRTYVVPAKPAFELLATNDLSDRSMFNASPAVAGGRMYIRSDRTLYCIGTK